MGGQFTMRLCHLSLNSYIEDAGTHGGTLRDCDRISRSSHTKNLPILLARLGTPASRRSHGISNSLRPIPDVISPRGLACCADKLSLAQPHAPFNACLRN